jgi:hypothetical protein
MVNLNDSPQLYLDKAYAIDTIADSLKNGCLTLFIGAGISKAATKDFPKWNELVFSCCTKFRIDFDKAKAGLNLRGKKNIDNDYLLRKMEQVKHRNPTDYTKIVKEALYDNNKVVYNNLISKELLVAIGSIIMGSIRGNSDCVINYNFDDLFEWYLDQHGYRTQVISTFPSLILKSDVNIYHPHGFLPLQKKYENYETEKIIFSHDEYESIITDQVHPWNEFQRYILSSKLGLFIGMSGDDKHVSSLCNHVYTKEYSINKKRILAFIILVDNKANREKEEENLRRGLVNLYINTYNELPNLLLSICQKAAEL